MLISRNNNILRSIAALALAGASALAQAGPIGYTAWDVSGNDKLLRIDLATGVGTVVGSNIGFTDVDGMSFDGSGRLWGVDDNTNRLVRIDLNTGAGTAVGAFGSGFNDMGLAWASGQMYMASTDNSSVGRLYTVDLATGSTTQVGAFGGGLRVRSLAVADGVLWGWSNVDTLLKINTSTGAATTVGAFGFASPTIGQDGMDADPATGTLWGISEVEGRTYTLNKTTGRATVVATSLTCNGARCLDSGGFNSLAIQEVLPDTQAVPEPGSLALLLGGLGCMAWARRRRPA